MQRTVDSGRESGLALSVTGDEHQTRAEWLRALGNLEKVATSSDTEREDGRQATSAAPWGRTWRGGNAKYARNE
jgi:hypothetical protein